MSYTIRDLLLDKLPEGTYQEDETYKYPDELDILIRDVTAILDREASQRIWELQDEWAHNHLREDATDYAKGVSNGLAMAAKELD